MLYEAGVVSKLLLYTVSRRMLELNFERFSWFHVISRAFSVQISSSTISRRARVDFWGVTLLFS